MTSAPGVPGVIGATGATGPTGASAVPENPLAAAGPPPIIKIPDIQPQDVGNTFTVDVNLVGAQNIHRVPLQITYDQTRMKLTNVVAGALLAKDGKTVAVTQTEDPQTHAATIVASRPPGADPVSGTGAVVTLTFQATARGVGRIEIGGTARGPKDEVQVMIPVRANVQILK